MKISTQLISFEILLPKYVVYYLKGIFLPYVISTSASTFRPLNSGKKPEKAKTRRRHRKTVMGIPQHIQRELGMQNCLNCIKNGFVLEVMT